MADGRRPNTAGQPNVVQSFSQDLDSMFGLAPEGNGSGVEHLQQTVEEKKQNVNMSHQELQDLEARLRQTEERLARVSRGSSPTRQADTGASMNEPAQQRNGLGVPGSSSLRPPNAARPQAAAREDTATLMSGMPGAMPQTPREYSGNSDYVMVDRSADRSERGPGQSLR